VNRVRFAVAGGALAGLDNGLVPATRIALLVPGYTGSKEDFQPLLRPLAAAGIRAVAIDQRGQYESSWAPTAEGYRVEALAEDVLAVADQLRVGPGRLHLLGHSFGGLVTRAATLAQPELFHDLVLMGSGPAAIGGQRREMIEAGEPVLSTGGMPALWEHLQRRAQADPRYLRPAPNLLAFLEQRFLATDPVGLRVMGQALRSEPDRVGELAAVGKPILILHGRDDDAWPPRVQADMAERLGAQRVVIAEAAHSPAVENPPATIAALTQFWLSPAA